MNSLKIEIYGSDTLKQKSKPIMKITPDITKLGNDMIEVMYNNNGIGLAAPQVGHNIRMFAIDTDFSKEITYSSEGEKFLSPKMPIIIINPKILKVSKENNQMSEGCLSVPDINANVIRPNKILLEGEFLNGEKFSIWCDGLLSRCVQHEVDHLNGIIFTDISENESFKKIAKKLKKLKAETIQKNK